MNADGKINRVEVVEFAASKRETRESYGQGESRSVNIAVIRQVQAGATQAPLSTYGMASYLVQPLFIVFSAAEMRRYSLTVTTVL
jgi:hypothetical protein